MFSAVSVCLSRAIQSTRRLAVHGSRRFAGSHVRRLFTEESSMSRSAARLMLLQRHLLQQPNVSAYCTNATTDAARTVLATRKHIDILDSQISYLDTGSVASGRAVVFLHGNPTSAYLWRNIIPHVQPLARCLAPDLIGMGHSGKNPSGTYRFVDHFRYLGEWFNSVNLPPKVTIVCHDWGSGLGFHWCNLNRERVEGLVFTEALVSPVPNWDFFPELARNVFQALRSPAGEEMVLEKNFFVEKLFVGSIMRKLSDEEMGEYRKPYLNAGESRRPTLTWPREIPVASDGPEDVVKFATEYSSWLSDSSELPKLYIDPEPGFFAKGIRLTVANWPNLQQVKCKGLHFVQEDDPHVMGDAIAKFLTEKVY